MALDPVVPFLISSSFQARPTPAGSLSRLFGGGDGRGPLASLFSGKPADSLGPTRSIFAPPPVDSFELYKGLADKATAFQSQVLTAINNPFGSGSTSLLSYVPSIGSASGIPGLQDASKIDAVSFLNAFFQPQFDLIGDVIDALS